MSKQHTIEFLNRIKDSITISGNFAEYAKKYSEDKESASIGGYLGIIPVSQLSEDVLSIINEMQEGDISEPVRVSTSGKTGYQIVYLKKRIPAHKISLETDWKRLEMYTANFKRSNLYQQWLEELRKEIYWEVKL